MSSSFKPKMQFLVWRAQLVNLCHVAIGSPYEEIDGFLCLSAKSHLIELILLFIWGINYRKTKWNTKAETFNRTSLHKVSNH